MLNKINYKIFALLFVSLSVLVSCDETGDVEVGGTNLEAVAGDWWAVALEPDGVTPAFGGDYVKLSTYNTAANDNTMWIDDHGNWMEIKTKVTVNLSDKSFAGEPNAAEIITDGTVTVTEGQITSSTYTTESNTQVDEITFKAEFSWDPGTTYVYKGHKRTGFAEDEDPHYSN